MVDTTGFGHYVYAVGEAAALTDLTGLTGIEDAPVSCTVAGRLCGLTSAVSVHAFRAAQQGAEMSENGWLAGAVRAHERVALHALERAQVLPMRFGTMYADRDDVHAMLLRHQESLLAELRRLADATEWCLTVHVADSAESQPVRDNGAQPASGTAWLLSRQAALRARQTHTDRIAECVERLRTALSGHTRDMVISRSASGNRMWLLVDDVPRLRAAVDELSTRERGSGVQLELTGPWPAYHFVRADALHDDNACSDNAHSDTAHADPAEAQR
jgi:hypothetical protein